jgi:ABC-type branched-subunit amino acid transport system substrate-binding protein
MSCSSHTSPTSSSASSTPQTTAAPVALESTEVGVTPTQIHIAVVADVNNSFEPGLFQASVDAVNGLAKFINGTGGIAGRQLVVDFYDSKLNPNEGTIALTQACQNDLALVGTFSVVLDNFTPATQCKDKNGNVTGLPDFTAAPVSQVEQQSPLMFTPNPAGRDYQASGYLYHASIGQYLYYKANLVPNPHGVALYANNAPSAKQASLTQYSALNSLGIAIDQTFGFLGIEPQSAYTAIVAAVKSHNSNFFTTALPFNGMIEMRREAAIQGLSLKLWDCSTCYDPNYLKAGAAVVDGTYQGVQYQPFEAASVVKGVKEYVDNIPPGSATAFGEDSWAAALLFRDTLEAAVKAGGNNAVTRADLLSAVKGIHAFTGDGLEGSTDVAGRVPSGCFDVMEVQNDKWVQIYPTTLGQMDCNKQNVATVTAPPPGT